MKLLVPAINEMIYIKFFINYEELSSYMKESAKHPLALARWHISGNLSWTRYVHLTGPAFLLHRNSQEFSMQ